MRKGKITEGLYLGEGIVWTWPRTWSVSYKEFNKHELSSFPPQTLFLFLCTFKFALVPRNPPGFLSFGSQLQIHLNSHPNMFVYKILNVCILYRFSHLILCWIIFFFCQRNCNIMSVCGRVHKAIISHISKTFRWFDIRHINKSLSTREQESLKYSLHIFPLWEYL